jgi:hypothetical protein
MAVMVGMLTAATVDVGGPWWWPSAALAGAVAQATADKTPGPACSEPCTRMLVGLEGSCVQANDAFS